MEETLTMVRLGIPASMRRTFATTNPLESVFDRVRYRTRRVKFWQRGKVRMVMRWTAAAGQEAESRLRRSTYYKLLNLLNEAIRKNSFAVVPLQAELDNHALARPSLSPLLLFHGTSRLGMLDYNRRRLSQSR
jgi:hypothetical protein